MGFTVLAMEESAPQAYALNDYLIGGEGDPEALVAWMGGWYIWGTEEFLGLVRWLRQHNDDPRCQLCFEDILRKELPELERRSADPTGQSMQSL